MPQSLARHCSGDIFQRHALAKLQAGSTDGFETYALNLSLPELDRYGKMQLPPSSVVYFTKCAELVDAGVGCAGADRIWVPRAANFAAIDLILPGQRPANFTIDQAHKLLLFAKKKAQGLVPVMESLGLPSAGRIAFYWVVPRERFDLVRESGGAPFPVLLRGPSRKDAEDAMPAEGIASAAEGDSRAEDDADDAASDHAVVASGFAAPSEGASSPATRGRGRLTKQPSAADRTTSNLDDYRSRIDQYLLQVPFDVLKVGAPTPPVARA